MVRERKGGREGGRREGGRQERGKELNVCTHLNSHIHVIIHIPDAQSHTEYAMHVVIIT